MDGDVAGAPGEAALPSAVHVALELLGGTPAKLLLCGASGANAGAARTKRTLPQTTNADGSPRDPKEALEALERLTRKVSHALPSPYR